MIDARQIICLASAAVVGFAGCGTPTPEAPSAKASSIAAINRQVTFHVPQMCDSLRLM